MSDHGPMTQTASTPPHRSMRWRGLVVLAAAIPLAGEALGHPYFARIGDALAHHAFHAATVVLAAALFWLLVAGDIKRNGVPPRLRAVQLRWRALRGALRRTHAM